MVENHIAGDIMVYRTLRDLHAMIWFVIQSRRYGRGTLEMIPTACKVLKYYVVSFQPCIGTLKLLTQP